jgi:hypothetical protein
VLFFHTRRQIYIFQSKKKAAKKSRDAGGSGSRGNTWHIKEDECLAEAWKVVGMDTCIGVNQDGDTLGEG